MTGETPPQSSMPAASSGARSSLRFGGAWRCIVGGQQQARGRDRPEELVGRARLGAVHRGAGLGQEVLDDHLLHVAVARGAHSAIATSASMRSARVSPMPTRMPVVNGTRAAAGGLERGEAALGGLVGRAVVRAAGLAEAGGERLDHHPLRRRPPPQPCELGLAGRAGVGVGACRVR